MMTIRLLLLYTMYLLFLCLLYLLISPVTSEHCRSTSPSPYTMMSTKTGYTQLLDSLSIPSQVEVPSCTPAHLWTVVRHGTRYPSKKAIHLINEDLTQLRVKLLEAVAAGNSSLCDADVELIKKWKVEVEEKQAKLLHPEGEKEMVLLGERWVARLPELLINYEEDKFRLRSTKTQRSEQSGHSFTTGMWTRLVSQKVKWEHVTEQHDPLIRFYKVCDKWKSKVKKNPDSMKERHKFEQSQLMEEMRVNMTNFLGLDTNSPLTMSDLDMMYVMCNFDLAWHPDKPSPWCGVFNTFQLQVMEYREELEYFWVDGPGYEVTGQQACVLARDMVDTFRNISLGMKRNGTFYFTHSGTILKFLTFLRINQDTSSLRSDNYKEMEGRGWRTSRMGPFGANVAFVLLKCEEEQATLYKLGLWVNEVLTTIPGCSELWCDLQKFLNIFPEIDKCDFNEICEDEFGEHIDLPDDKY